MFVADLRTLTARESLDDMLHLPQQLSEAQSPTMAQAQKLIVAGNVASVLAAHNAYRAIDWNPSIDEVLRGLRSQLHDLIGALWSPAVVEFEGDARLAEEAIALLQKERCASHRDHDMILGSIDALGIHPSLLPSLGSHTGNGDEYTSRDFAEWAGRTVNTLRGFILTLQEEKIALFERVREAEQAII